MAERASAGRKPVAEPFDAGCTRCPRLSAALAKVRKEHESYYARPVPAFGVERPKLLVVGLAPGLHGANRTGRPFTGDGAGVPLYQTLHALGLATRPHSVSADDGLKLRDCAISNSVRCWPPENKPLPDEIRRCNPYILYDLERVPRGGVVLALGAVAHGAVLRALALRAALHPFRHGGEYSLPGDRHLLDSYHCSRYNLNTGRITQSQLQAVFERALQLLK